MYRDIVISWSRRQVHPSMDVWWPHGHIIGWEHTHVNEIYYLLNYIDEDKMPEPNSKDGVKCHQVQKAVEKSIQQRKWVRVDKNQEEVT